MVPNRYPGVCKVCGITVAPQEGFISKEDGAWVVCCKDHVSKKPVPASQSFTPTGKTNSYASVCYKCSTPLTINEGYLYKSDGKWFVFCIKHLPDALPSKSGISVRTLSADGVIRMPYEADALPYLRAFPKAHYNGDGTWSVSLDLSDRRRVLELADQLKLDVDPNLRQIELSEQAKEAKDKLRNYQVDGVDWLSRQDSALLCDEMGLGKTIQTLMSLEKGESVIVVCPAGVKHVWEQEIDYWRPDFNVHVCEKTFRLPEFNEIVIVSYNMLPQSFIPKQKEKYKWVYEDLNDDFIAKVSLCTLIGDEIHYVKNYKTARSKKMWGLVRLVRRRWGLTGTPFLSHPGDLYGVLSSMNLISKTFKGWKRFTTLFNAVKNEWGGIEWGEPAPEVPEILRRVMLRRLRKDVLPDLPDVTYQDLQIDISKEMSAELDALQDAWYNDIDLSDVDELPPFEEISKVRKEIATSRIPAMLDYVGNCEEQDNPIVVFSSHREPIEALDKREGWLTITGSVSAKERAKRIEWFKQGFMPDKETGKPILIKGMGLTIQAGGVGITLVKCGIKPVFVALFVDMDWTPANNAQAIARLNRLGQESNKILCVRMVSNHPLDRRLHSLLDEKTRKSYQAIEAS